MHVRTTQLSLERALHMEVLDPFRQFVKLLIPLFSAETPLVDHARDADGLRDQSREEPVEQRRADEGPFEDGASAQAGLFFLFVAYRWLVGVITNGRE